VREFVNIKIKNIILLLAVCLVSNSSFALPTSKLTYIIRRGLQLSYKKISSKTLNDRTIRISKFLLEEIKNSPLNYGLNILSGELNAKVLSDIKDQNTINQIILNSSILLRFLQKIKTYGDPSEISSYASNIKYMDFRAVDYTHVTVNPYLLTGLGREMDQKLMANYRRLPYVEIENIAKVSHQLLKQAHNLEKKEQIKQVIESTIILANMTGYSIFKDFREFQSVLYLDIDQIATALFETIQKIEISKQPPVLSRSYIQSTFYKKL
jgi:hypothetical protein